MEARAFKVSGMTCAACSARVERAVSSLPSVDSCEVNLLLGKMTVSGVADDGEIISAVRDAGYSAVPLDKSRTLQNDGDDEEEETRAEIRTLKIRLISSVMILLALMYISMGHIMWGFPLPSALAENPVSLGLIELLLSAAVLLINKSFFVKGFSAAARLAPNMDTLVALGSSFSFLYSLVLLFMISGAVMAGDHMQAHSYLHGLYFESAAMIPALITLGKLLEAYAKGKTTVALKELISLTPKTVNVIREGKELSIPVSELRVGEIFVVRRGESIAADGIIAEGEGSFDEACLSGESIPADKGEGDKVFGATVLTSGFIKVRAERVGEDTAIAEIIKMVKDASGSKAPVAKIADRVAGIFVPTVLLISLVTLGIWLALGAGVGISLERAVTVLVISCPCALGLATPVAIMVGSGVGARCGVLYKNATALEVSGRVRTVALDKTGTITEGKPVISDIVPISDEEDNLLRIAASLEAKSEHPLARAIVSEYEGELCECESFTSSLGGVSGELEGRKILGGNPDFIERNTNIRIDKDTEDTLNLLSGEGKTPLVFSDGEKLIGIIALQDKIREDSREAVATLHKMGIRTVMLTGDNEQCARAVAEQVGIEEYYAGVFPASKETKIRELKENGTVAMIGDGINDAPALVTADLGIAIGAGTNVAIDSANVVLVGSRLSDAVCALKLGRRVLRNIYQNLFWAFCYNIVGIPLAAGAFSALGLTMKPMFGALAMSISSFIVVMNALRLNLFKPKREKNNLQNQLIGENNTEKGKIKMMTLTIKIEGMMCPHCSGRVRNALEAVEGVASADVSHERGDAVVSAEIGVNRAALAAAVEAAGYKVVG